ncbi:Uncharacterized conserved protein YraI [Salinihabitans flavidus]|uniref:Uncharacterized conserved protein YraI n=1 Tax=Salinihabitans flavidus TaxID=569882 RepID=A0A1H8VQ49_9RHOB|nr:DUF1236 domain-containing protein [Salinihabitans flavidus]SEP17444.1 Uncharacterized conserved protein YraI [Salinihabitans flavidus]
MYTRNITLAATALSLAAAPAMAATVQAVTDLNMRAGPGPQYEIIGVIDQKGSAEVEGCFEEGNWCRVSYEGNTGWAYGEYLTDEVSDSYVPIVSEQSTVEIGTVTYENEEHDQAIVGSGTAGAVAGAIIGGPVGAVAGAIAGGTAGAAAEPREEVVRYVRTNRLEPVYLEGEVVTGVQLPESVDLQEIPNSEYRYVYLNGAPVLVDAENRTVVHIAR